MIAICVRGSKRKTMKVLARYSDGEEEMAIAVAEDLIRHGQNGMREVFVCLVKDGKYWVLKKVLMGWNIRIPTLRHPFMFPSRGVIVR